MSVECTCGHEHGETWHYRECPSPDNTGRDMTEEELEQALDNLAQKMIAKGIEVKRASVINSDGVLVMNYDEDGNYT